MENLAYKQYIEQLEKVHQLLSKGKDAYNGNRNNKGEPYGYGTMKYSNGDYYNGLWVNGKKEGKGCMDFQNGDKYDGEWKNDNPNGFGTMNYFKQGNLSGNMG